MQSTLILNASYEPLSIVSAKRALKLIIASKATSIDDSSAVMRSADKEFKIPYVILLNEMSKVKGRRKSSFSKRGVLIRDNFTCVYCNKAATTIDHVYPQMLGGKSTYDNCVAACKSCNSRKNHQLLKDLGWKIPQVKSDPTWFMFAFHKAPKNDAGINVWSDYLAAWEPRLKALAS